MSAMQWGWGLGAGRSMSGLRVASVLCALPLALPLASQAAVLTNDNISVRTTRYDMSFSDLSFSGAFNLRSDQFQFQGNVGDSGGFSINGFTPGQVITVTPAAGVSVSNLQPANATGVISYTVSIVGPTDRSLTQSWINHGTLSKGITASGLRYLDFNAKNSGILSAGGVFDFNVSLPGNWSTFGTSTGQVQLLGVNPEFTVTKNFVYDAASDRTTFEAVDSHYTLGTTADIHFVLYGQAAAVPEPTTALLFALGLGGFAARGGRAQVNRRDAAPVSTRT